jgi:phytanoyl-CoA dioxygenase PhyH
MSAETATRPLTSTASQRAELSSRGFTCIPSALDGAQVERLTSAIDRIYARESSEAPAGAPMHLLGGIGLDSALVELVDHPAVFPLIWGELGWNIHVYHCHLDVTPPRAVPRERPVWGWHQDGGRQNLELDCEPRPRLSLKVAYWLTDLSEPGRGNMLVIPGSHTRNSLPRPAPGAKFTEPAGATPVLAAPGDALVFDRRLWHSRSDNLSVSTRKAIFLAYTYRWVRPRDSFGIDPAEERFRRLSAVRRQLLGDPAPAQSQWGLGDNPVPLRIELDRRELLDPSIPAHR